MSDSTVVETVTKANANPASAKLHSDTDVLIVGAGPIGLTLALLLAKRGRSVAVYERWRGAFPLPRAAAMSHESVRTYQSAGVLETLRPNLHLELKKLEASYYSAEGQVLMTMVFPGVGESGYPPMTGFHQPDVDRLLGEACDANPLITVYRGWNALSLVQTADTAIVTLGPVEGDRTLAGGPIHAGGKFVVGCDGANSVIRSLIVTDVTDTGFSSSWLVVDTVPGPDLVIPVPFGTILDPARPALLAPAGQGRQRFEFMIVEGDDPERIVELDSVLNLLKPWGVTTENTEIARRAIYTFRGRWAESWRDGRVLLAGDAAHQMPPFMGQGFNSGIRDCIALAWRIDLILGGKADAGLLDSYTSERLAHVKQIVEASVMLGQMICVTHPQGAAQRDMGLRMMQEHPEMAPPQPEWRLGPGCLMPDDPAAGFLAQQALVEKDGKIGLLDDLIGPGHFVLLGNGIDPLQALSSAARAAWVELDGLGITIGQGGYCDVEGSYGAWFEKLGASIVLARPDFQVYGASSDPTDAGKMILTLAGQLRGESH